MLLTVFLENRKGNIARQKVELTFEEEMDIFKRLKAAVKEVRRENPGYCVRSFKVVLEGDEILL